MKINKSPPTTVSYGITLSIMLGSALAMAADTPSYEQSIAYIQEKGIVKDIQPNSYYDPTEESKYHTTVKIEYDRKIQFPDKCVMEIVNERSDEVAPPTSSESENRYAFTERETLTLKLSDAIPSTIYVSPKSKTFNASVIVKTRKGGFVGRTERFFDQPGNKTIWGATMQDTIDRSIDSPFGKFTCGKETCTRSRKLNGYGISPSEGKYADGLRDALIHVVKMCGGTG